MDDYIWEDETNTLKNFCENVYKGFSHGQIPHVTSSSTSDSSHSHSSKFPAATKYQDKNDGFNLNKENGDDYEDKQWREDYQQVNKKGEFSKYNLLQDSHNQKTLANICKRVLTN